MLRPWLACRGLGCVQVLENVILAFSRDPWVRKHSAVLVHKPLTGYACQDQVRHEQPQPLPPSPLEWPGLRE